MDFKLYSYVPIVKRYSLKLFSASFCKQNRLDDEFNIYKIKEGN